MTSSALGKIILLPLNDPSVLASEAGLDWALVFVHSPLRAASFFLFFLHLSFLNEQDRGRGVSSISIYRSCCGNSFFSPAGARADNFDVDVAVVASLLVVLVAPAVVAFADVAFHNDSFSAVVASFVIVGAALIFAVVAVVVVAAVVLALVTSLTFAVIRIVAFVAVYLLAVVGVAAAVS